MKLKDQVAIVTGGAQGIGRAIAVGLAREGAAVFLCSADSDYVTGHVLAVDGGWLAQ